MGWGLWFLQQFILGWLDIIIKIIWRIGWTYRVTKRICRYTQIVFIVTRRKYVFLPLFVLAFIMGCFVFIDEEVLVVLLSISWVWLAGDLLYKLLYDELQYRGTIIRNKFLWYMLCRKQLLSVLITEHRARKLLRKEISFLYGSYCLLATESFIVGYLCQALWLDFYARESDLYLFASYLSSTYLFSNYNVPFGYVFLD